MFDSDHLFMAYGFTFHVKCGTYNTGFQVARRNIVKKNCAHEGGKILCNR